MDSKPISSKTPNVSATINVQNKTKSDAGSAKQSPNPLQLNITNKTSVSQRLQPGQLVSAQVIQKNSPTDYMLQTSTGTLAVRTNAPLALDQQLQLQVIKVRQEVTLQLLQISAKSTPLESALRVNLPKQSGLAPLLANLHKLANDEQSARLPKELTQAVQQTLAKFPQLAQVANSDGVKQAIDDSGLLLEAKLLKVLENFSKLNVDGDFKALLLRLHKLLQQLPAQATGSKLNPSPTALSTPTNTTQPSVRNPASPAPPLPEARPQAQASVASSILPNMNAEQVKDQLIQQIEGALARIRLSQLASVPETDSKSSYLLEIPVNHKQQIDLIQLRIDREAAHDNASNQHIWSVELAFDFDELGPIHAKVKLNQDRVSTQFWASQADTAEHINKHLEVLQNALIEQGLQVDRLFCQQGVPSHAKPSHDTNCIVNEKV